MKFTQFVWIISATMLAHAVSGLSIAGSDLLNESIRDAIVSELAKENIEADIQLSGSLVAMADLREGKVDACIMAIPDESEPVTTATVYVFGFQVVTFAVNVNNPLAEVDYKQLGDIFRSDGAVDNWTLNQSPDWNDRKINLWAARSDKAISLEIFNSVVLKGSPLKNDLRYTGLDVKELILTVENDESVLMVLPNIHLGDDSRLLAVKAEEDNQSYTPSQDNIFYGDYPLRLPFKLVISNSVSSAAAAALVKAIYSDEVTSALEATFYMPVPEVERKAVLNQIK